MEREPTVMAHVCKVYAHENLVLAYIPPTFAVSEYFIEEMKEGINKTGSKFEYNVLSALDNYMVDDISFVIEERFHNPPIGRGGLSTERMRDIEANEKEGQEMLDILRWQRNFNSKTSGISCPSFLFASRSLIFSALRPK